MAGDLEDQLADAIADAYVRRIGAPDGLKKADAAAFRKAAWQTAWSAARQVIGEQLGPQLAQVDARMAGLAGLEERIEWLEVQQAERMARYGGGGNG